MRRIALLLFMTIAATLVMISGAALAEVTRTTTSVIPFTLDNPCTDETEPITFSGTATFLRHFVQDKSPEPGELGGTHFITRIFADDIVGTDTSGQEYRLEEVRSLIPNQNNSVGPEFVRTLTTNYRVFSSEGCSRIPGTQHCLPYKKRQR